jgi:hypothetical protein
MTGENRFHCCATCEHFLTEKREQGIVYRCSRLAYETRPEWQFHCWSPKERVKRLMAKEMNRTDSP